MKLSEIIKNSILSYPTLYKFETEEQSRIAVLNHLFFVIGNGYEWESGGSSLTSSSEYEASIEEYPEDFFNRELWKVSEVKGGDKSKFIEDMERNGIEYYSRNNNNSVDFHIFTDRQTAYFYAEKYGRKSYNMAYSCRNSQVDFYPICEFSNITHMLNGKTDEGEELPNIPEDFIAAGLELCLAAREYYHDEERYSKHIYFRYTTWEGYRAEQLDIIESYIEKYS